MPPVKDNAANLRKNAALNRHLTVVNTPVFSSIYSVNLSHAHKSHINQLYHHENIQKMKPFLTKKQQSTINFEADNRAIKWATALSEAGNQFSKLDDVKFRKLLETVVG